MKRRLRKKKKLGEFREYGFQLVARYPAEITEEQLDSLLMELFNFVEHRNLGVGGGCGRDVEMFVCRLCRRHRCCSCIRKYGRDRNLGPVTEMDRSAVVEWFRAHGALAEAGPLIDANHHSEAEFESSIPKLDAA